jgi:hypothetical protein
LSFGILANRPYPGPCWQNHGIGFSPDTEDYRSLVAPSSAPSKGILNIQDRQGLQDESKKEGEESDAREDQELALFHITPPVSEGYLWPIRCSDY